MVSTTLERSSVQTPLRGAIARSLVDDAQRIASTAELVEWADAVYRAARGDERAIPWCHSRPNPALVAWLNAQAPGLVRPGARTVVVGCGLGRDVIELVNRGYDAVGFDCSQTAVEWAQREHPGEAARFIAASLCDLPARFKRRFDLVVEVHTIQSAPPALREPLVAGMAELLHRCGLLVAVARGREESVPLEDVVGPPYPLTAVELESLMKGQGLSPLRPIDDFTDDNQPPIRRLRGVFAPSV